jgi:hypothetical protein
MKKQFINSITKKAVAFSLAFALILAGYSNSFASASGPVGETKAAYVTYKGLKDDNHLVFRIDYKNESEQPFQLVIKNDHGDVLYSKAFDAKPLNSNILLTELPDNSKLTFSIVSKTGNYSQSFKIDSKVRTTQEYIVKGL